MDPFLAAIYYFGGNFAMRGFTTCDGQILSLAQNTALFSLLGTTYGGDGRSTFGLPDLRGRIANGQGQGPGLSVYDLVELSGTEKITLLLTQLPSHSHLINASSGAGTTGTPTGAVLAKGPSTGSGPHAVVENFYNAGPADTAMHTSQAMGFLGGGQPMSIVQPTLCVTCVIALTGIYPSRS
jgi:microcystin-dependent protein